MTYKDYVTNFLEKVNYANFFNLIIKQQKMTVFSTFMNFFRKKTIRPQIRILSKYLKFRPHFTPKEAH